jgi:flavorubredoxin
MTGYVRYAGLERICLKWRCSVAARELKPGVYAVGAIDWDRRLFDELIPLPHGTSYNSYLIRGSEKTALIDAATIVIASPTVLASLHPAVPHAVSLTNALRPKLRFAAIIGSYGWGGRMVEQITGMLGSLKLEFLEPVLVKGYPKEADLKALDRLADDILKKHQGIGIIPICIQVVIPECFYRGYGSQQNRIPD